MKNYIFIIFAFAAIFALTNACENAEYSVIENRLFINEAAPALGTAQQVETLTIEESASTTIHVRLAQPLDYDVVAYISVAPEFVDEYNAKYETNYEVLSEEYFTYDTEAVITAGNVMSSDITINVSRFESDVTCCIPLKITSTDSHICITENTSRIMFVLTVPLVQPVPIFTYQTLPFSGDNAWNLSLTEWTLEFWVWNNRYNENKAIFTGAVSKGVEIYCRFEDPVGVWNTLQMQTGGTYMNSNTVFELGTWYHVAYTWDSGSGKIQMYVNGEEDISKDLSLDEYILNSVTLCGSGSTYFKDNLRLAQMRLWNVALSQALIQKQMNGIVPSSDQLVAYWKMDEGRGNIFYDSSPNGRDLTCAMAPAWSSEQVNFEHPND